MQGFEEPCYIVLPCFGAQFWPSSKGSATHNAYGYGAPSFLQGAGVEDLLQAMVCRKSPTPGADGMKSILHTMMLQIWFLHVAGHSQDIRM